MRYLTGIGILLIVASLCSTALYFFGWRLKLLIWIEHWGDAGAWSLRAGILVVGIVLAKLGDRYAK